MAFFAVSSLSAQQLFYAEGGEIQNLVVDRANGEVTVTMDIDVTDVPVGGDDTLVLVPVITDDIQKLKMPGIELMGRRAYLFHLRNDNETQSENPFTAQRAMKRAEKKAGGKQVIPYTHTFTFEEWMRGCKVALRTGECACGKLHREREEVIGGFGHEIYQPTYVWSFIEPDPEPIKVRDESHSAYINFYVDKYNIVEKYKNNATELAGILESISKVDDDEDLTIKYITIEGWASPEDTEQHNQTLSENRANSLADWVTKKTGIERSNIDAVGRGEDWAGLRREVEASNVEGKKQILAIIDEPNMSLDGKDWALKSLVPPTIYQNLLKNIYHDNEEDATWIKHNIDRIARNFTDSIIEYLNAEGDTDDGIPAQVVTMGSRLNMRSSPSITSPIIRKIPNGSSVTVLERQGNWYKIVYGGQRGYVAKRYLAFL